MKATVKVTEMLAPYAHDGVSYGPFQASQDTPFLEVPERLAQVLNLPRYEGPGEGEAERDAVDVETLLRANHDLKADLDRVTGERDRLQAQMDKTQEGYAAYSIESEQRIKSLMAELDDPAQLIRRISDKLPELGEQLKAELRPLLEVLNTALAERTEAVNANTTALKQVDLQQTTVVDFAAPADAETGNPGTDAPQADTPDIGHRTPNTELPADFPMRALLVENGFDTLEKVRVGLLANEQQKESPVQAIDGIGPKTIEAIKAALA